MNIRTLNTRKLLMIFTVSLLSVAVTHGVWAAHYKQHRLMDGLDIYLTIVPAEMIRGHPKEHFESQMHGGVPTGEHYHVIVTMFSHETKQRVVDANVMAKVVSDNFSGPLLKLEHMILAGKMSFGNYVVVPANEAFNVILQIRVDGKDAATKVRFVWART